MQCLSAIKQSCLLKKKKKHLSKIIYSFKGSKAILEHFCNTVFRSLLNDLQAYYLSNNLIYFSNKIFLEHFASPMLSTVSEISDTKKHF